MVRWIAYKWRITKLAWYEWKTEKAYAQELRHLRGSASREKIEGVEHSFQSEVRLLRDEAAREHTLYLLAEAGDQFIDVVPYFNNWQDGLAGRYLPRAVLYELRQKIRKEKMETRQAWLVFLPALTGLTGLIGAVIGLTSLLFKK